MDSALSLILADVRPALVRQKVAELDSNCFTAPHAATLLAATYNVNGKAPPTVDLSDWLRVCPMPDIVAVGFQEIVPLSASNVVLGASPEAAANWDELIRKALNDPKEERSYQQVAAKQMVGLYLSVWVCAGLLPFIRGVQATSVGTGIMRYLGNKGAVAVRLQLFDTSISLINCHLSSGQGKGDSLKRHSDCEEILRRGFYPHEEQITDLEVSFTEGKPRQVQAGSDVACHWGMDRSIASSDLVFWMGDLNYRLNMPDALARKLIQEDELEALADGDELTQARRAEHLFSEWHEGPLHFPPTYKFRRGTDQYSGSQHCASLLSLQHNDTMRAGGMALGAPSAAAAIVGPLPPLLEGVSHSMIYQLRSKLDEILTSSQKVSGELPCVLVQTSLLGTADEEEERTPAWTDRVLWKFRPAAQQSHGSASEGPIRQLSYASVNSMTFSDHRAVHALFCLQVKELLREKVRAAVEAARREVDARELARMPRAKLKPLFLDLGLVACDVKRDTVLTNIGQVAATWKWAAMPTLEAGESPQQGGFPPWVSVHPETGRIEPHSRQLITISVSAQHAKSFADRQPSEMSGKDGIEDLLHQDVIACCTHLKVLRGFQGPASLLLVTIQSLQLPAKLRQSLQALDHAISALMWQGRP